MNKVTEIFDTLLEPFDDKEIQKGFVDNIKANKIIAALAYIVPILFFLPIVKDKYSPFCKFHANQSLLWLIVCIVVGVIGRIIGIIPLIGGLINIVLDIVTIIIAIVLAYGAYNEKAIKLPVIGDMLKVF